MNRSQRRAAARSRHKSPPAEAQPQASAERPPARPGFILRLFAAMVLAPWVLKRVTHPAVERLLAEVAMQAGRTEVAASLMNRMALRAKGAR